MQFSTRSNSGGDADWSGSPGFYKWGWGVVCPLLVAVYAVRVFVTQHVVLRGKYRAVLAEFHGWGAVSWGVAALGVGLFIHCHCYWADDEEREYMYAYGRLVALGVIVLGVVGAFASTI